MNLDDQISRSSQSDRMRQAEPGPKPGIVGGKGQAFGGFLLLLFLTAAVLVLVPVLAHAALKLVVWSWNLLG